MTSQGPATRTQCALAVGGCRGGRCWLATWPPPAAPGAAASLDAGLGTWRETQPRGLTDTGGHRARGTEPGSAQMAGPVDPRGTSSPHLSSTKERADPGPHPARPAAQRSGQRGCRPCQASNAECAVSIPKILQYREQHAGGRGQGGRAGIGKPAFRPRLVSDLCGNLPHLGPQFPLCALNGPAR